MFLLYGTLYEFIADICGIFRSTVLSFCRFSGRQIITDATKSHYRDLGKISQRFTSMQYDYVAESSGEVGMHVNDKDVNKLIVESTGSSKKFKLYNLSSREAEFSAVSTTLVLFLSICLQQSQLNCLTSLLHPNNFLINFRCCLR